MAQTKDMSEDRPADDYESALAGWFPEMAAKRAPAAAEDDDGLLMGGPKKGPEHFEALERVQAWTRERFKLGPEDVISVAEVTCQIPGCPPLETAVVFWDEAGTRHHFKLLRPVIEVTQEQLPFAWMKDSLVLPEGFGCECC